MSGAMSNSISLSAFSCDVQAYVDEVVQRGTSLVLERDHTPIATLSPVADPRSAGTLAEAFAALPRLPDDDAEAFAHDVGDARQTQNEEAIRDPWDS